ncbi:MAG TPA: LytTR family DNA-binding domain-containing protein [Flavobacteriaceae bacterium]|nr:LytTR family DNA-binding domain-containing protein [Flavobacteriaceae bacterium]
MLNVILVDDEPKAIKALEWQIRKYCKDVKIDKTFTNPKKAIKHLETYKVDCVFLDVEMPAMDGFAFLKQFDSRDFEVVFTTAYSRYAIQAIRIKAKDYLLKPVDPADLINIVNKLKVEKTEQIHLKVDQSKTEMHRRLAISSKGKLIYLDYRDILFCESDGNYCKVHLVDERSITVTKKLKEIQKLVSSTVFCRVHHSYIINMEKVKTYIRATCDVILENGVEIPVSRSKRAAFLKKMGLP